MICKIRFICSKLLEEGDKTTRVWIANMKWPNDPSKKEKEEKLTILGPGFSLE